MRFWFPLKVLFSVDHIPWFESNCTSDVTNTDCDWLTAAAWCDLIGRRHTLSPVQKWLMGVVISFILGHIALVYIFPLCASTFFLLPLSLAFSLSVYFVGVPSFSVWLLTACAALISPMGQIRVQGVCACVCALVSICMCTHLWPVFPVLDAVLWLTIVWTANPIVFSLTDLRRTKTTQITNEWLTGVNIDHTPKHPHGTDIINKSAVLYLR